MDDLIIYNIQLSNENIGKIYTHDAPFLNEKIDIDSEWEFYNITTVVSLLEEDFHKEQVYCNGIEVINFPIEDYEIPADDKAFAELVTKLVDKINKGENISIHCYMGHGRTGVLAAILYAIIEGVSGDKSIEKIRDNKVNYVESENQREYVNSFVDKWNNNEYIFNRENT
jgi:protein-tyrosine phosphatase